MKLLIITPIYPPQIGGPASYVSQLIDHLPSTVEASVIFFTPFSQDKSDSKHFPVPTTGNFFLRQLRLVGQIFKLIGYYDLVYIQGPLVVGLAASVLSFVFGKPVIIKFVGDEVWEPLRQSGKISANLEEFYHQPKSFSTKTKLFCQRLSFSFAKKIITPSKYLKDLLVSAYKLNPQKIVVIPNAVELKPIKINKKKRQLIFVGRLVPWKNLDQIIRAVVLTRKQQTVRLLIVGSGPEEKKLKRLIASLNAQSFIRFLGSQNRTKTLKLIAQSEKLILYSSYEGLPHVIIEAMLLGTQVVASSIRPNREVLAGHGLLVEPNNTKALARAISSSPPSVKPALNYAQKHFSWAQHIKSLLNLAHSATRN